MLSIWFTPARRAIPAIVRILRSLPPVLRTARLAAGLLLLAAQCMCLSQAQAASLRSGESFWDGETLYHVTAGKYTGSFYLKGVSANDETRQLSLSSDPAQRGRYVITGGDPEHGGQVPYGCLTGAQVRYVSEQGMHFLAFYVEEHTIGQVAVRTVDSLENLVQQQAFAENETDPLAQASDWLMNQRYLSTLSPQMQEEISARLQQKRKPSVIERTNRDLVSYALAAGISALPGARADDPDLAQQSDGVSESSEEFDISLRVKDAGSETPGYEAIVRRDGKVLQVIEATAEYAPEDIDEFGVVSQIDVSFDNRTDLLISLGRERIGNSDVFNQQYDLWVYDPVTDSFRLDSEFRHIENPEVDAAKLRVLSHYVARDGSRTYTQHKWEKGKLKQSGKSWNVR